QVEAAVAFAHRQAQALRLRQGIAYLCGQATAFRAEQKGITGAVVHLVIGLRALGGEGKQAGRPGIDGRAEGQGKAVQAVLQVGVALERRVFVIVQPGAAQALVVQLIAEGFDQMQLTPAVGAQPDNVAGIGWNFRLKKDDVKHARYSARRRAAFYSSGRPSAARVAPVSARLGGKWTAGRADAGQANGARRCAVTGCAGHKWPRAVL